MKRLEAVLCGLLEDLIRPWTGPIGARLRRSWYRRRLARCGANLTIEAGVHLVGAQFIALGDDCWIDRNAVLIAGPMDASARVTRRGRADIPAGRIAIGSRCHLGIGTIVQGHGGVRIGDDFTTSAGCKLYSVSNDVRGCRNGTLRTINAPTQPSYIAYPVEIGSNVWLGLDVKVIGHTIGDNVFLQAGSVVSQDLADNVIAAGAPAAALYPRFEGDK